MKQQQQELTVITKTYDLILWTCGHTSRFSRNPRYVLGDRIERGLYDLLETLIAAKYSRQRKELLERANLGLEILRFQMRLAKDQQCLRTTSYGFAAKAIDEIGRLVGGFPVERNSFRSARVNADVTENGMNSVLRRCQLAEGLPFS